MRREERVTVQGPVKEQQPDGMSHRAGQHIELGFWPKAAPEFQENDRTAGKEVCSLKLLAFLLSDMRFCNPPICPSYCLPNSP